MTSLPPARGDGGTPYRLALVCLGNICRSPIAEVVLAHRLDAAGLTDDVRLSSAGTGGWHVGGPMDRRASATLTDAGYDGSRHRAQQIDGSWFAELDAVLVMDADNLRDVTALAARPEDRDRVLMFRDFDPRATGAERDVPDPYYGGDDGFGQVLAMVERTADALVPALVEALGSAAGLTRRAD